MKCPLCLDNIWVLRLPFVIAIYPLYWQQNVLPTCRNFVWLLRCPVPFMCISVHNVDIGMFYLHIRNVYVSWNYLYLHISVHNVDMCRFYVFSENNNVYKIMSKNEQQCLNWSIIEISSSCHLRTWTLHNKNVMLPCFFYLYQ